MLTSSTSEDGVLIEILLKRADHVLVADGGHNCGRVLSEAEIDLLLAGDEPKDAA